MKKRLLLFVLLAFAITLSMIANTFALFETNGGADAEFEVGKWKIKINDSDVSLAQTITLNDFVYSETTHTDDGYFAPGRSASFDIVIDTSESDVSVTYNLDIDDSILEEHPNIAFSVLNINTNEELTTNNYSGVSYLSDTNRVVTLRLSLNWTDDEDYDENDTALIGEELSFNITAHFEQYTGA